MNKYSVTYVKSGDTHTTNVWANSEGEAWSLAKQSLGWDFNNELKIYKNL